MRRTPARPVRALLSCIGTAVVVMIVAMTAGPPDDADDGAREGADGSDPGPGTLTTAVDATRAVARARVELRTTVAGPSGPVALIHRAAFTDGGARASAVSDMSEVAAALVEAGQQLDGDWSQPTGIVVDGDTVFSQLGPMAEALGRSPEDWSSARLSDIVAVGDEADNDTLALVLDPMAPLDLLRRPVVEIGEVGALGDEDVRDTPTRHLRALLDVASGPAAGSLEARLAEAGLGTLPVDVWLDADGLVRRLQLTIEASSSLTTTFDVYDVDGEIEVTRPDPADVVVGSARANGSNGS